MTDADHATACYQAVLNLKARLDVTVEALDERVAAARAILEESKALVARCAQLIQPPRQP
jgi:hypothetical protein